VCGISQLLFNESLIAAMQLEKRGKKIKEKETFRPTPGPEEYAAADGGIIISEKALGVDGRPKKEQGGRRVLLDV
jgi:hypothetical protein